MECVDIHSRLIASVAYYRKTGTLRVWFHSNRCAVHGGVSEAVFKNLVEADSPGFYYSRYIADGSARRTAKPHARRLALSVGASVVMLIASGLGQSTRPERVVAGDVALVCSVRCPGRWGTGCRSFNWPRMFCDAEVSEFAPIQPKISKRVSVATAIENRLIHREVN